MTPVTIQFITPDTMHGTGVRNTGGSGRSSAWTKWIGALAASRCVCVRERESERGRVCVCMRERECVCVCVYVRERYI